MDSDELNDQLDNTINADDIATGGVGSDEVADESLSIFTDVQGNAVGLM